MKNVKINVQDNSKHKLKTVFQVCFFFVLHSSHVYEYPQNNNTGPLGTVMFCGGVSVYF